MYASFGNPLLTKRSLFPSLSRSMKRGAQLQCVANTSESNPISLKLCMPFSRFHEAIEKVLDRPVYTHEFGLNYDGIVKEFLGEKEKPTLKEIINLIPKEKLIILNL